MREREMKTILVSMDWSIYADSVLEYAIFFYKRLNYNLNIFHVIEDVQQERDNNYSGLLFPNEYEKILGSVVSHQERFDQLENKKTDFFLNKIKDIFFLEEIKQYNFLCKRGIFFDQFVKIQSRSSLIVLGKRGVTHQNHVYLGENIEKIVCCSNSPVLVVPRVFSPIHRVLLAYDGGNAAQAIVNYFMKTRLFEGIECHLVVVNNKVSDQKTEEIRKDLETLGSVVVQNLKGKNVADVIDKYVDEAYIDLIALGAYSHSPVKRFFFGSTTKVLLRTFLKPIFLYHYQEK